MMILLLQSLSSMRTTKSTGESDPCLVAGLLRLKILPPDYESFRSMVISFSGTTSIQFLPRDDHITLDDRVILIFTPQNPHLLAGIEAAGQYIRQNTTINIIDTDS